MPDLRPPLDSTWWVGSMSQLDWRSVVKVRLVEEFGRIQEGTVIII